MPTQLVLQINPGNLVSSRHLWTEGLRKLCNVPPVTPLIPGQIPRETGPELAGANRQVQEQWE
jgi:hypothetical protein